MNTEEDTASIILTIYNQESTIAMIFLGIVENISECTKEIICILDGCTDYSEYNLMQAIEKSTVEIPIYVTYTPNINETLANNVGLRLSKCKYSIIVQDDCLITEKDFDKRILKPFKKFDNLLAVSGRDAVDMREENGRIIFYNCSGYDVNTPRDVFGIRDGVNRGPLAFDNEKLKKLNYFDESFAPQNCDDADISLRGYTEFGYIVGSYVIDHKSEYWWGQTRRNPESSKMRDIAEDRNMKTIIKRHADYLAGPKHSEDIIIPE